MGIDARPSMTLRTVCRLVGIAGAVLLLALVGAARAQAAITDIHSAGPLTDIFIGSNTSCQVAHTGDVDSEGNPLYEFFSPGSQSGSCGTDVSVGSGDTATLFRPGSWTELDGGQSP